MELALGALGHLLMFSELVTAKVLSRSRYVHPEASLSANGAGALDLEAEDVGGIRWRWQVDVAQWNIWGTIVAQWQEPNLLRGFAVLSCHFKH